MPNKKNSLIGRVVMVDPDYSSEPGFRPGQIGKIICYMPENNLASVLFKDGCKGAYLTSALLMLRPKRLILKALLSGLITSGDDCKTMLEVYRLMALKRRSSALHQARSNTTVEFYCTTSCQDWMSDHEHNRKSEMYGS
jgi:hypothetical protein